MHKSIIVLLGLLVILLPIGTSFNNQNANAIADFDKEVDKKHVSVSSLKCNNINVNVNGLELDVFPTFLANSGLAAEAIEGNANPSSIAGNNGDSSASEFKDFRFICINNNNNTVIQEEIPLTPLTPPEPEPSTPATLTVKKLISCQPENGNSCIGFALTHRPSDFSFQVTGNNPQPRTFNGSAIDLFQSQNNVTIGPGPYTITETIPESETGFTLTTTFSGSCIADTAVPQKATGTIVAGTDQNCEIINTFTALPLGSTGAQSSLTAQGTADSPELTTTEKLTKLKTQWLNQLP